MASVITALETSAPGGRNTALNHAAWTLGRWVATGALEQGDVEDELYAAAERNGLVTDDGQRQCWATIRSGLSAGLQQPIDFRCGPVVPRVHVDSVRVPNAAARLPRDRRLAAALFRRIAAGTGLVGDDGGGRSPGVEP
jgi:hypothetical protein